MRENRYDRIVAKMLSRIERVTDRIVTEFKGSKPFDKEAVSMEEQIVQYKLLTSQDAFSMIETYGVEAFGEYQNRMEEEIRRRGL